MFTSLYNSKIKSGKEVLLELIMKNDPSITTAIFDSHPMYQEDVETLARGLLQNRHLKTLSLLDCRLTPKHMDLLLPAIQAHKGLTTVTFESHEDYPADLQSKLLKMDEHLKKNEQSNRPRL